MVLEPRARVRSRTRTGRAVTRRTTSDASRSASSVAHLVDDRVVAAGVEERVPVAAVPAQVVLATLGVGQHAVDVDDDGPARVRRRGAPPPVRPLGVDGHGGARLPSGT